MKGMRKAERIKNWLAENIPPGPKFVEYMAPSTVSDVRYVRFHLRREDIGVLVFFEDWGVEELSMIDELGGSLDVPVVRRSSLEHPPTEHYMINRDRIRNLKIRLSTCKRIIEELNSYDKEVEREAVKTIVIENKGSDPQDLLQQKAVLARSKMVVADCHKRLEAALTDLKGTLAELLQSGWSGQEIGQARSTISEADTLLSTDET
ncbi:tubulin-folding cofactor A-like [Rhododendron vialii]|uniref:tubulin-folding cofactor A-like n=1 Tax=Rhododendron vialii TaxID=182163 RepID=UPI00265E360B|nr:tubulin-folding cofactor A-like [Rhododendron vialii]